MPQAAGGQNGNTISCINCRTRKVRCDKVHPCGPCQKVQLECTFRAKKARPKKSAVLKTKSNDINSRLDRLDQLVNKLGSLSGVELPQDVQALLTGATAAEQAKAETGPGIDKPQKESSVPQGVPLLRSDFWMNLSDEVEGLRHTLYADSGDEVSSSSADEEGQTPASNDKGSSMPSFIFGGGGLQMSGRRHPNAAEVLRLSEVFFERVDPIFKFMHVPTVRKLIGRVVAEGGKPALSKPEQALMYSIYFAAVNSMADEEYALLQQDRRSALMYYKACTEAALTDADLLCTTDLSTLQSLTMYLLALRSIDSSQSCWSLAGLAIRLAQALDLHRDVACTDIPAYDVQMRRRLYWILCLLDVQSFQDRGLAPLLQSTTPAFPSTPANVDDADFGPQTKEPVVSRIAFTEMTVPLLTIECTKTAIILASRPNNLVQPNTRYVSETLRELHNSTIAESLKLFDMSKPICWFSKILVRMALLKIFIFNHIPVHIRLRRVAPQISKEEVLTVCITLLELSHMCSGGAQSRFSWYNENWHQWHPLAVALAELISTPTGPLADRAWVAVQDVFLHSKKKVADGSKGTIWRPIKRLHERARRARLQALGVKVNTPSSSSTDDSSPNDQLGLPLSTPDTGDERHRLHDAALIRALELPPGTESPILFNSPSTSATSNPQDLVCMPQAPTAAIADPMQEPINWDNWNAFLQESMDGGYNVETLEQDFMQGIMQMPLDMNASPTSTERGDPLQRTGDSMASQYMFP